jgi:2-polyprenyl-3-methyl-5-hydroxy-6-metoxy-1,4-benzoquinol methylase
MRPDDRIMAEQIAYYRHRAAEYDATAYGDTATATARIDSIVAGLGASGSVLELVCGTGMWTQSLARHAAVLTALDSSPEAVAIARQRTANPTVRFVEADVFSWVVRERFDLIFFAFLLSHIPSAQLEPFLKRVGDWLAWAAGSFSWTNTSAELQRKASPTARTRSWCECWQTVLSTGSSRSLWIRLFCPHD